MARAATNRLKVNPPLGRMPVLQYLSPGELEIDGKYQRSIEGADSQTLIRKIAQHWNWDLCLPLVVARRRGEGGERYFVIDGQHRLEAARLRGDISQLPCQVVDYANAADEAASFVHLNQQRRPLSKLDLFKAAVASEDPEACAILRSIEDAGLSVAPHTNPTSWKPGMIGNVQGIEKAWRNHGRIATSEALQVLGTAFTGEVMQYAGTLFPGIVAVCVRECRDREEFDAGRFAAFTAKLGKLGQPTLREQILTEAAADEALGRVSAAVRVITELWQPELRENRLAVKRALGEAPVAKLHDASVAPAAIDAPDKAVWCDQCDARKSLSQIAACKSAFCTFAKAA